MKTIIPTTPLIEQMIGQQKRADGQQYRLMTYVVKQPVDDGLLLYNTLTCSLVLLTPYEAADLTAQWELIDRWFLVPEAHDDRKLCRQVRQMAALLTPAPKVVTTYTILPTTGCNARCFYCFEQGTKPVTMTAETASRVVRYIVAHHGDEEVTLHWFGGEPLVNVKVIDQICTELNGQGVPFRSEMTTNGYLIDADMVQRAKELWKLQWVQITLDGTAQTYNRDIDVRIRLNVDKHNIGEMAELIELLHQRFGAEEHLSVSSSGLYGERAPEEKAELFAQLLQLEQQIARSRFNHIRKLSKDVRPNHCMADNDGSVVIAPDGHLSKCEHFIDREFFGHIDSEERDIAIIRKFKERRAEIEACATCPFYPQCYRLVMCENDFSCTPETLQLSMHNMMVSIKYEYECYLNKKEN